MPIQRTQSAITVKPVTSHTLFHHWNKYNYYIIYYRQKQSFMPTPAAWLQNMEEPALSDIDD